MNSTEVTVDRNPKPKRFEALDVAIEAAALTLKLVAKATPALRPIADQAIRSSSSVAANLSEGQGREGRDSLKHFRIAYAEAREIDVHLRLLAGAGAINGQQAKTAIELFDRVRAMTWKLLAK